LLKALQISEKNRIKQLKKKERSWKIRNEEKLISINPSKLMD